MTRIASWLLTISLLLALGACSKKRSDLIFQGQTYAFVAQKASSGGKFDIATFRSRGNEIHLVLPREATALDSFAKLYTQTFKAQRFTISSVGNEHVGVGPTHVVYLTAAPKAKGVAILLLPKTPAAKMTVEEASEIFSGLRALE